MSAYTATRVLQEINARPAYLAGGAELESSVSAAMRAIESFRPGEAAADLATRMIGIMAAYGLGPPGGEKPFAFANGVAVIPIHGILINRFPYTCGYVTGYDFIRAQVAAAAEDPDVKLIAFDIHSSGGTVAGCPEAFRAIMDLRGKKPTAAMVDSAAYSAAYYLASAAERIILTPSGGVGSIGTLCARYDVTKMDSDWGIKITFIHAGKYKLDGNPHTEMGDSERERIQASVDAANDKFVAAVAEGRGLTEDAVRATEAQCYDAEDALRLGLVTDIMTSEQAIQAAFACEEEPDDMTEQAAQVDVTAVRAEAATAERARVSGILSAEEARDRPRLARHLATNTGMSVEDARGLLAAAAVETAPVAAVESNPLEAAMNAMGTPNIGADPKNSTDPKSPEAKSAQILAAYTAATGTKFN